MLILPVPLLLPKPGPPPAPATIKATAQGTTPPPRRPWAVIWNLDGRGLL